eukprot:NODE_25641_length_580_cov_1.551876.p1 GENE.NODE_25641_length_580_cov_1.551876~~NODE_25641_length_580_cov_1.551876.p1  ORF type:complete len:120 (+),score=18.17 NODE_25641_length_580_cov_1.551876:211-570(+)
MYTRKKAHQFTGKGCQDMKLRRRNTNTDKYGTFGENGLQLKMRRKNTNTEDYSTLPKNSCLFMKKGYMNTKQRHTHTKKDEVLGSSVQGPVAKGCLVFCSRLRILAWVLDWACFWTCDM